MIEKIKYIKNLAVFKDFDWDTDVVDANNKVREFSVINVIYGRNYSGKTTLSRIIRAMETGFISDKYENPEFCIKIKDGSDIIQNDLVSHNKTIRVFNEDFIKANLKFINNPDEDIQSFAILGDNVNLEKEIQILKNKLGSQIEDEETKLYKDLKTLADKYQTAKSTHSTTLKNLDEQIKSKAINNPNGIKYKSERFGDQNYTTSKLKNEINIVLANNYKIINEEEKKKAEKVITEKKKASIDALQNIALKFVDFSVKAEELITLKIGRSDKIDELVKDAVLNRWVKEGKILHQQKRTVCAFCNNKISDNRWEELDRHFDEESNKLEKQIINLLSQIDNEKKQINTPTGYKKEQFYSEYHTDLEQLSEEYSKIVLEYIKSLELLEKQLKIRKDDLLNEKKFNKPQDYSDNIISFRTRFDELRENSDNYTKKLSTKQNDAKKSLRLKEIYDFAQDIKYSSQITNIELLKKKEQEAKENKRIKLIEIKDILSQIDAKQKEQKDERKGADKIREYLSDFFGHRFLNLDAIEVEDEQTGNKKYVFEIQRNGEKAYHLSEGEQSLIAFCYFMAKLEDIETKFKKPIIWIDDPISSLDSNHIFFLYSLIKNEILEKNDFEQLFVATHNLDFLKYLKRLNGGFINSNSKFQSYEKNFFIINRVDKYAKFSLMPKYLKEYITEFNYLFHQIYKCTKIEEITDENYTTFYNFGNNARKFLEIYLFYKYPDFSKDIEKYKKFFGKSGIPAILTDRVNNEYSHMAGGMERGASPIEVPEMKKVAELIIAKLKEDNDQYTALLKSIGEYTESETILNPSVQ